jgi:hypothetical protein
LIFQFQAGISVLYIIWARNIPTSNDADRAIRDCSSTLAIFADASPNAEHYRDSFDELTSAIFRRSPSGAIDQEGKEVLKLQIPHVAEVGAALHVLDMLREMCGDDIEHNSRGQDFLDNV